MTIVKNDLADAFVKQPPEDLRLFLVHGNDDGLIHERAKALVLAFVVTLGPHLFYSRRLMGNAEQRVAAQILLRTLLNAPFDRLEKNPAAFPRKSSPTRT